MAKKPSTRTPRATVTRPEVSEVTTAIQVLRDQISGGYGVPDLLKTVDELEAKVTGK